MENANGFMDTTKMVESIYDGTAMKDNDGEVGSEIVRFVEYRPEIVRADDNLKLVREMIMHICHIKHSVCDKRIVAIPAGVSVDKLNMIYNGKDGVIYIDGTIGLNEEEE